MAGIDPDVSTFLERLVRLDPGALVRVRSVDSERAAVWGHVPWGVLVTRTTTTSGLGQPAGSFDVTVSAAAWLDDPDGALADLKRLDAAWRGPLPSSAGVVREMIEASVVRAISVAAASTLRARSAGQLGGRALGERAVRDALLDHVPIVVESDGERIEVSQRLIQAVIQMGFLGGDSDAVRIRTTSSWVGVSAAYGVAWSQSQNVLKPALLPDSSRL